MSKINAVRFINLNYNNNAMKINDECMQFSGKSTLLSVISNANPKIANYPFTTLYPNLGMVAHNNTSFVVADIPGLIEGASEGAGLGHYFLRHVERVRVIVHMVDISESEGRSAISDYEQINKELKNYSEEEIIAAFEVVEKLAFCIRKK